MNELVKLVVEKVGLSEDLATQATNVVVGYLKEKLPEPIASQLSGFLGGQGTADGAQSMLSGVGDALGGLMGDKS